MWWIIGGIGFVAVVGISALVADRYGQGKRGVPGRHEDTGEFPTVQVETPEGYGEYRTAVLPVQRIPETITIGPETPRFEVLKPQMEAIFPYPRVPTDTVMMEAVDPTKYPDWIKEELERDINK